MDPARLRSVPGGRAGLALVLAVLVAVTARLHAQQPADSGAASPAGDAASGAAVTPGAVRTASFERGVAAYDRGDFQAAFANWLPLAEQGSAAAQFNIAALFENGQGVARSEVAAARWYLKAAEQGDPEAQFKTGWFHEHGRGVALDLAKARYWYARVLAQGPAVGAGAETLRLARERLARVSAVEAPADILAYPGGRFVVRNAESGACVVALQGAVNGSASAAFEKAVAETVARRCNLPVTLLLESPGGLVKDGLWLGAKVRQIGLRTVARYDCASACAMIFVGGVERVLYGARAAIGLHQAAWSRDMVRECEAPDSNLSLEIRDHFRRMIPSTADVVFELAMKTSCNSIAWVRGKRAVALGLATSVESEDVDLFGPKALRERK